MPKTRLISPGSIPNHKLLKNLQLQDNYLSNDGGNEGIRITDAGNVGVNTTAVVPASKLEIFNTNVQHSAGTASQSTTAISGSGTTFTEAMVGGRFIFDDGTDAGIITAFIASNFVTVSTSQTVSSGNYKIYYPSVQIATESSSTTIKLGDITIGTEDINLGLHGDFTVNAQEDIALSADGGNITMNDGSTTVFDFDVDNVSLKIMDDADTGDYCSIGVGANGATTITTVDDDGAAANLTINTDGAIALAPTSWSTDNYISLQGYATYILPITKTASGTADVSLGVLETLNLSSGAGGSDVHYGIKYTQTQTDLTGWDSVYLMYLTGGAGKILSVDSNANVALSNDRKVVFGNAGEYIVGDGTDLDIVSSNHVNITSGGQLIIQSGGTITMNNNLSLPAGEKIFFDSADTFIGANSDDPEDLLIEADQDILMSPDNSLVIDAGGHVEFDNCAVGFDKLAGTFGTSGVIGNGFDSTDIDFRLGNKYELELTDTIAGSGSSEFLNLIFPATSGNFILVISQDGTGSRLVHGSAWVAYQSDGSTKATNSAFADGTDGALRWAGGSTPTLTTTADKADIISIYWDADNQTAFAVASLNF